MKKGEKKNKREEGKESTHGQKCTGRKKSAKAIIEKYPLQSNFIDGHGDTNIIDTSIFAEQFYRRTW